VDRPPPPRAAIIVHGGAWAIPDGEWNAHRAGVERATAAGWDVLVRNGSALDAVETVVALLEDDPTYDAGTGSVLTREGHVEMDAAVMDGRDLRVGAVACVRRVRNPVRLARRLLAAEHAFLVGPGAETFAAEQGIALCDEEDLVVPRERERLAKILEAGASDPSGPPDAFRRETDGPAPRAPTGTVGAVAIDRGGNVAAAGSTGGVAGKRSGRVGDTPVPGAGLFADNRVGGAACTGWGESILRVGLARNAVQSLRDAAAQDAAWLSVRGLEDRVGGRGGVVVLSRDGSIGFAFNTPRMAVAYMDGELVTPFVGGKPLPESGR
jgi:beta-aspartyl-peptidase (threonine type)